MRSRKLEYRIIKTTIKSKEENEAMWSTDSQWSSSEHEEEEEDEMTKSLVGREESKN
jgi:hypothetical protein